jgi:hypothetical protein
MKPKLEQTTNYGLFKFNKFNRPEHEDPILKMSMQKHGFLPSCPIHVKKIRGSEKLEIMKGHTRFRYAKELKLPVWYIIDETEIDIFEAEAGKIQWSLSDYLFARANAEDEDCKEVIEFMDEHGIAPGMAVDLLGKTLTNQSKAKQIKMGTFFIGDKTHAIAVTNITDYCRTLKLEFATSTGFVKAISMTIKIPELDFDVLHRNLKIRGSLMKKRSSTFEYLQEIEKLYNHGLHIQNRIPIAYRAREISLQRKANFGGNNVSRNSTQN